MLGGSDVAGARVVGGGARTCERVDLARAALGGGRPAHAHLGARRSARHADACGEVGEQHRGWPLAEALSGLARGEELAAPHARPSDPAIASPFTAGAVRDRAAPVAPRRGACVLFCSRTRRRRPRSPPADSRGGAGDAFATTNVSAPRAVRRLGRGQRGLGAGGAMFAPAFGEAMFAPAFGDAMLPLGAAAGPLMAGDRAGGRPVVVTGTGTRYGNGTT